VLSGFSLAAGGSGLGALLSSGGGVVSPAGGAASSPLPVPSAESGSAPGPVADKSAASPAGAPAGDAAYVIVPDNITNANNRAITRLFFMIRPCPATRLRALF